MRRRSAGARSWPPTMPPRSIRRAHVFEAMGKRNEAIGDYRAALLKDPALQSGLDALKRPKAVSPDQAVRYPRRVRAALEPRSQTPRSADDGRRAAARASAPLLALRNALSLDRPPHITIRQPPWFYIPERTAFGSRVLRTGGPDATRDSGPGLARQDGQVGRRAGAAVPGAVARGRAAPASTCWPGPV